MARFDLYAAEVGYILDVQTDLLYGLNTRLVVPLLPIDQAPRPARRLNPVFELDGERYALQPQYMASVPGIALGKPIKSLRQHHDRIVAAIDMIFLGF